MRWMPSEGFAQRPGAAGAMAARRREWLSLCRLAYRWSPPPDFDAASALTMPSP
jgi:hypothetical protein